MDWAGLAQAGIGAAQAGFGAASQARARKERDRLDVNRVDLSTPSAFRERAAEPISEQFRRSRDELAQRRIAQSVGAAAKGGARTLLAAIPSVLDSERKLERDRYGTYEQARIDALGDLGMAQEREMAREQGVWNQQMLGAQTARAEAIENLFGGGNNILRGLMYSDEQGLFDIDPEKQAARRDRRETRKIYRRNKDVIDNVQNPVYWSGLT